MEETIDFKNLKITQIREDLNLFMFNNPNFSTEEMKFTNQLLKELQNVKIKITTY